MAVKTLVDLDLLCDKYDYSWRYEISKAPVSVYDDSWGKKCLFLLTLTDNEGNQVRLHASVRVNRRVNYFDELIEAVYARAEAFFVHGQIKAPKETEPT